MNTRSETDVTPDSAYQGPGTAFAENPSEDGTHDWENMDDRHAMISEAAYFRAEQRGFTLGAEELDWLEAESELLEQMTGELTADGH